MILFPLAEDAHDERLVHDFYRNISFIKIIYNKFFEVNTIYNNMYIIFCSSFYLLLSILWHEIC